MSLRALLESMAPAPRSSSGQVAANARWRAKNPGKQEAYDLAYRERNRDVIAERHRARRRVSRQIVDKRLADNSASAAIYSGSA